MKKGKRFVLYVMLSALTLLANIAAAEESLWVYTKGSDTRPKGSLELKLNNISRLGKNAGDYSFHDIRPEVEYGITDRLTVGAEIMFFHHDYSVTDEIEPMVETQGGIGGRFKETQYAGFELAMKYNFLSPYKDFIGLSLALSYERREKYRLDGADIEQDSFVITPLFQKDFLDDTLVFAFNPKIEFERRTSTGILEEEIAFDISAGVSYRVAPKWFIGLELRHQSDYLSPYNTEEQHYEDPELQPSNFDFTDITIGTRHQYGLYIGPTVHYAEQSWWITAGVLWQIRGGGTRRNAFIRDNRNWDEHEEVHIGLFFGYALF